MSTNSKKGQGKGKNNISNVTVAETGTEQNVNTSTTETPLEEQKKETTENTNITPESPEQDSNVSEDQPAEEIIVNAEREVRAFWHKECADEKKSTKTKFKSDEHLRKTAHVKTIPNPAFVSEEETPDVSPTLQVPIYSLKRGNRIYYITDVLPQDIVRADQIKKVADAKKEVPATV